MGSGGFGITTRPLFRGLSSFSEGPLSEVLWSNDRPAVFPSNFLPCFLVSCQMMTVFLRRAGQRRSEGNPVLPLPTLTGLSPRRSPADIGTVTTLMGTGMYMCMCMYVCMYVCRLYGCMCVCMYVCMYVWMYVCMYVPLHSRRAMCSHAWLIQHGGRNFLSYISPLPSSQVL